MSPKKAKIIYIVAQALVLLLAFVFYIMDKSGIYKLTLPFVFAVGITVLIVLFIDMAFWRCKHCGRHLGKNKFIEYCPHCGLPIE